MSRTVTFFVPGVPVAKGRHRTTKGGHNYPDPKTVEAEANVAQWYMAVKDRPKTPWEGPVVLDIEAIFPIPKSWPKWKKEIADVIAHCSKPDYDNIAKLDDALNQVAWKDDSQIYDGRVVKQYGEVPGVRYTIRFEDHATREDV